ncbi:MAG TPA: Asp-tRNA(Asn)/Glu-tRNA(Gln) amidotransferase subunit GatC [Gemmatales bacterium]|nr:Asp-tRNA(Asn)/Glu-tRNA(Gln) amidotransferase subunit GatC [Gemmatales bacterium]HMP58120.1 Asp-tRNA(Asn)/Glu-tRNA(Gln) amidotransferase subunit GatC [Gemmatales bacterium]
MTLTDDQIRWIAHLARLECGEEEIKQLRQELNDVIAHVDTLAAVDVTGVEPLSHPLPLQNVFRDDEPRPPLPVAEMLANAPARKDDFYAVPAVLE